MKVLIISKGKFPPPPEAFVGLLDAMTAWVKKNTASGKVKTFWATAGTPGGGGIAEVDSFEELDAIMAEFPFGPFSDTQVIPIVDLGEALQRAKQAALAMMPPGAGGR